MTSLFQALARAKIGKRGQGTVFIDDQLVYLQEPQQDGPLRLEMSGASGFSALVFADQDVEFTDSGVTRAVDTDGRSHEVQILVTVPYGPVLQVFDSIRALGN